MCDLKNCVSFDCVNCNMNNTFIMVQNYKYVYNMVIYCDVTQL